MQDYISFVWLGLAVLFVILEAATEQLVSVWFIAGAVAALVLSLFETSLWWQLVAFIVVSGVVLVTVRPLAMKRARQKRVPTNADMLIGETAVVSENIDNDAGAGRVEVDGLGWSARSADGAALKSGAKVRVCRIEGVKLIVKKLEE